MGPTGEGAARFRTTSASDRQVLADVDAVRASYLITEDVDDFGADDLRSLRLTAVNADLFMALRFSRRAYLDALGLLVENMKAPHRSLGEMHALLARQHLRLFAANSEAFDVAPTASRHDEPSVLVRGVRCVSCASVTEGAKELEMGLCLECGA